MHFRHYRLLIGLLCLILSASGGCRYGAAEEGAESNKEPKVPAEEAAPPPSDPLVPPIALGDESSPHAASVAGAHHTGSVPPIATDVARLFGDDFRTDPQAHFHPHGKQVCASGCAASNHPTGELRRAKFRSLLQQFASEPMNETSQALETLLYYGRQTAVLLKQEGSGPPDALHTQLLREELGKTHVLVNFRIVDRQGRVRTQMTSTRVPLDHRHVFQMETDDLAPLVTSGTVKRVGLHHLWTRI